jgi:hypothetical protein
VGTIACNCVSIGALGKLLIETSGNGDTPRTFNSNSKRIEFIYETLGTERNIKHNNAITGFLGERLYGARQGSYVVQGVISLQMSPLQIGTILPLILGGTPGAAGSGLGVDVDSDGADINYPLANNTPTFDALVYREAGIFHYRNLRVAQAVIRGKAVSGGDQNEFIEMMLVCIGQDEIIIKQGQASPWPVSEPALPTTANALPYQFHELDLFLDSSKYNVESFTLTIDNNLMVKWFDEQFPGCIRSTGRTVSLELELPFTCAGLAEIEAMHNTDAPSELRFATPSSGVQFHTSIELPYSQADFITPTIQGRQDIPHRVRLKGFDNLGNDSLIVTNDATPTAPPAP